MTRTVTKENGSDTWLNSNAFTDESIPLDIQMGTGHLNARRALKQFEGGETDGYEFVGFPENQTPVPQIGWDYDNTFVDGLYLEYEFQDQLPAGSYVAITLTWNRELSLDIDNGVGGEYDVGDTFEVDGDLSTGFSDLNILFHNKDAQFGDAPIVSSMSTDSNVEHLFFQIQTTGFYEFWVEEFESLHFDNPGTDYAVAWWAFDGPVVVAGDYDGNGIVEQSDYVAWSNSYGQTVTPGSGADGNNNGIIDAADYTVWRDAFSTVSVSVPEPSSSVLFLLLAITCGLSAEAGRTAA